MKSRAAFVRSLEALIRSMLQNSVLVSLAACASIGVPAPPETAAASNSNTEAASEQGSQLPSAVEFQTTKLTELPAPIPATTDGFELLVDYVDRVVGEVSTGAMVNSAIVDPGSLNTFPKRRACYGQPLAILIDLDPGSHTFDLDDPPFPHVGLPDQLQALREKKVSVLWVTSLDMRYREEVAVRLGAVGLFSNDRDAVLASLPGLTKQDLRMQAARQFCIVAIAGDQTSDFDEAFVYLRDPTGPIATVLLSFVGDGWFLTRPPTE